MLGNSQRDYKDCLPRTTRPVGEPLVSPSGRRARSRFRHGQMLGEPVSGGRVRNTLRVDCLADDIRHVHDENALADRLVYADAHGTPATIIGGGSNLVLRSRLHGMVIV